MTRLTGSQKMLLGVLALVAVAWGVDTLLRTGPQPAAAATSEYAVPAQPAQRDWTDVQGMVSQLLKSSYEPLGSDLDAAARDVFVPSGPSWGPPADLALEAPSAVIAAEDDAPPAETETPFDQLHQLHGVVLGPQPVALIDERVLPLNSDLDGWVLIEVERTWVTFESRTTGARVRLELPAGPRNAAH
jgi:hypothetical protein